MQSRLATLQFGETLAIPSQSPKGVPQVANGGITLLKSTWMSDQATKYSKYWTKLCRQKYKTGWQKYPAHSRQRFRRWVQRASSQCDVVSRDDKSNISHSKIPHFPRCRPSFESTENLNRRRQSAGYRQFQNFMFMTKYPVPPWFIRSSLLEFKNRVRNLSHYSLFLFGGENHDTELDETGFVFVFFALVCRSRFETNTCLQICHPGRIPPYGTNRGPPPHPHYCTVTSSDDGRHTN